MNPAQFERLMAVLEEYAGNMPEEIAAAREQQIRAAGRNIWFAWAGEAAPGRPHYYRIQTAAFLVEFDDTQNHANHIHSVWRDFQGDFGTDLLAATTRTAIGVERPSALRSMVWLLARAR